jgi:hypothetical protein
MKLLVIQFGRYLHPEEKNVTKLYYETCALLGIDPIETTAATAAHAPTPGDFGPKMGGHPCPKCGKNGVVITGLCSACKEAEGGKYKCIVECLECGDKEKSEDPVIVWLERLGVEFGNQTKASLGIKTLTDEGLS